MGLLHGATVVLLLTWHTAVPHLRRHAARSLVTICGVMLGVAVLVAVQLAQRTVMASVRAAVDDLAGKADLQVAAGRAGIDERMEEVLRAIPGVFKVAPVVQVNATIDISRIEPARASLMSEQSLTILGLDLLGEDDWFRPWTLGDLEEIRRAPDRFMNADDHIVLGSRFATRYGYQVHDRIPLHTPSGTRDFEIWGFLPDEKMGRALGGSLAVMFEPAAQVAFERGSIVDRFDVAVAPGADVTALRDRIAAALGPGRDVDRPQRRTDSLGQMLMGFGVALAMSSLLALSLAAFLISNTIAISVTQRRHEIGILRALGALRRDVRGLFLVESGLMGAIGSALGVLLGLQFARLLLVGMTRAVSVLYLRVQAADVQLDWSVLLLGLTCGVATSLIAAALPAHRASVMTPIDALGSMPAARPRRRRAVWLMAIVLLIAAGGLSRWSPGGTVPWPGYAAIGCVLASMIVLMRDILLAAQAGLRALLSRRLPVEVRLANDNLSRDAERLATTASALGVAVVLVISFAVLLRSFETSVTRWVAQCIPADLFLTAANPMSLATGDAQLSGRMHGQLVSLPGVEAVNRVRLVELTWRGVPIKLMAIDWAVYSERAQGIYLEGTFDDARPRVAAGGALITESFSRRFDRHRGDLIELPSRDGLRAFRVAGVVIDYSTDRGMVIVDRSAFAESWNDELVDTYELYLHPQADREAIRRAVRAIPGGGALYVLSNAELKREFSGVLSQVFRIVYVLQLLALIVAVLGVSNLMLASVLDRAREIGVLRAVGALRRQVRRMVIAEAVLLGGASSVFGALVGLCCGAIVLRSINTVQTGWFFPFSIPSMALWQTVILVVIAGAVAGWYPAFRAARMAVTASLQR